MKKFILLQAIGTLLIVLLSLGTEAAEEVHTCRYQSAEIGTVTGKGKTEAQAFENAAVQCFDRHQALVREFRGEEEAKKRGLLHIDICANITCS